MQSKRRVSDEFDTVDLILGSGSKTRGVDAFALSLIKVEKQARRLFTYLMYQHAWCTQSTIPDLRKTLAAAKGVYFDGVLQGWNELFPTSIQQLVGADYPRLMLRLDEATRHRNKIFHGQLTSRGLSRADLESLCGDLRTWRELLADGAETAVGYNGCGNAFCKAVNAAALCATYKQPLANLADYQQFIVKHMKR